MDRTDLTPALCRQVCFVDKSIVVKNWSGVISCVWTAIVFALGAGILQAQEAPKVCSPDKPLADSRLGPIKTLDDYHPFYPPENLEEWEKRSERVRRQMLVALGLWPMPTRTPQRAVIHGKVDRDEYTVERVYLESFPGHFVTGNLYRPKGGPAKKPGVLCPHGHWANGRFYDAGDAGLKRELENGWEKLPCCGRYPLQARCVHLARMGCVVFHYDMVGYADSIQIPHRPGMRAHMNTPENWGYFSPQAELHLQNMMGLQTWNSIRVLDWFTSLPDVDPNRIGITGASGGGTQTFILCALDPRPLVAFPAVMVSTAMQGGCTCENACYLRIGTSNVEFAALFAPKALGMTSANDWTKEMPTKGFPELQRLYQLYDATDRVYLAAFLDHPHNYNYHSRLVMYRWMNKHLGLGLPEPIDERPFRPLSREEMTVWTDDHPKPPSGEDYERSLLRWITEDSRRQIEELIPQSAEGLAPFRKVIGGAVDVMIGRGLPPANEVDFEQRFERRGEGFLWVGGIVRQTKYREEVPVYVLVPRGVPFNGTAILCVTPNGKQDLVSQTGSPHEQVLEIVRKGYGVVAVDVFGQGESTLDGQPITRNRLDPKRKEYAGYTYGYNHPLFAQRVHDILTVLAALRARPEVARVYLVGLGDGGRWAAAALAQASSAVDRAVIDTAGFRFRQLSAIDDPDFLPGAVKYLDLPGMLALAAPVPLLIWSEQESDLAVVRAVYEAAGAREKLVISSAASFEEFGNEALRFLLVP
ncbi:MAG: acetylxylan esterase [Thermoguttaceae bacterium]|nr:acetylxylan esterase [Thermoguttaceae bacterium]MDW8079207.1 alpha/beta hydrolase family protein [Thermoguttaceae bacterium]